MPKKTKDTKQTKAATVSKSVTETKVSAEGGMAETEIAEIKEAFDLFDVDKSGAIDVAELKKALNGLGIKEDNQTFARMMADIDSNGDGQLSFNEFLSMMTAKISDENSREELEKVFDIFLGDSKDDKLDINQLRDLCDQVKLDLTEEDLKEMILRADTDRDGKVSFEEFFTIITKKI